MKCTAQNEVSIIVCVKLKDIIKLKVVDQTDVSCHILQHLTWLVFFKKKNN